VRPLKPLVRMPRTTVECVRDLFIPGTRVWNEALIRSSFLALEAAEVLKIKLSNRLDEDVIAWAHEKHGAYSVKSAYKLLKRNQMEKAMADDNRQASASGDSTFWKVLWKLNVPPKVRVFWWRVLHNSLPSKSELKRRHVARESHCEVCGSRDETLLHVFFDCPLAKRFWKEVKKETGMPVPSIQSCTWARDVLHMRSGRIATTETIICGAWALWTGRNARGHGCKSWEPGATARFISKLLEDLASLKRAPVVRPRAPKTKWEKPSPGWFKINTDAGFDQVTNTGSAGVVIRDQDGLVAGGSARWFEDVPDVLTAEAMAAREGLELAVELGLDRVMLEVDCQELSKLLLSQHASTSHIGGLCFDILELGKVFSEFKIRWIQRDANSVANLCASMVSATDRCHFWIDNAPGWLVDLAAADCNLAMN